MLKVLIPGIEYYNEDTNEFVTGKDCVLKLEHSLLSISKWEAKWEIPFLNDDPHNPKTDDMLKDYIRCMTLNDVGQDVYTRIPNKQLNEIMEYMNAKQSATTFIDNDNQQTNKQIVTSELLYYYMVTAQIPLECERWHINRLMNLIRIYSIYNQDPKDSPKTSKRQSAMSRSELNKQRQKIYNTKG